MVSKGFINRTYESDIMDNRVYNILDKLINGRITKECAARCLEKLFEVKPEITCHCNIEDWELIGEDDEEHFPINGLEPPGD